MPLLGMVLPTWRWPVPTVRVLLDGMVLVTAPVVALTASVRPTPSSTPPFTLAGLPAAPFSEAAAPQGLPATRPVNPATTVAESPVQAPRPAGARAPQALATARPHYTSGAMRARIQGTVVVEAIVLPDGTVGKARVTQSLDCVWGLDEQALIAARKWTFVPGTLNAEAVPVRIIFMLEFRMQ